MSGRYYPLTPDQKAILDQLSRATDPSKENLEHLCFELETSPLAREAFAAEIFRLRALRNACHGTKARLPKAVAEALDRLPKNKGFQDLLAQLEAARNPQPELDLIK